MGHDRRRNRKKGGTEEGGEGGKVMKRMRRYVKEEGRGQEHNFGMKRKNKLFNIFNGEQMREM